MEGEPEKNNKDLESESARLSFELSGLIDPHIDLLNDPELLTDRDKMEKYQQMTKRMNELLDRIWEIRPILNNWKFNK